MESAEDDDTARWERLERLRKDNYWKTPVGSKDPRLCVGDAPIARKGVFYVGNLDIPVNNYILGIYSGRDVDKHCPRCDEYYYYPTYNGTSGKDFDGICTVQDIEPLVHMVTGQMGHNIVASFVNHNPHGTKRMPTLLFGWKP